MHQQSHCGHQGHGTLWNQSLEREHSQQSKWASSWMQEVLKANWRAGQYWCCLWRQPSADWAESKVLHQVWQHRYRGPWDRRWNLLAGQRFHGQVLANPGKGKGIIFLMWMVKHHSRLKGQRVRDHEMTMKQTVGSRCHQSTANGQLPMSIPFRHLDSTTTRPSGTACQLFWHRGHTGQVKDKGIHWGPS